MCQWGMPVTFILLNSATHYRHKDGASASTLEGMSSVQEKYQVGEVPTTMRAIEIVDHVPTPATVPVPSVSPGEVLVKVMTAGVNRGDLLQAAGHYPPPPGASEIMGLECSGVVVDAGDTGMEVGTPVACLLAGGGYAEYVAVPVGQVMPIPAGFSFAEAAGIVEVACTVVSNLSLVADVTAGDRVLIHGGAGGIGTFAIQYCKSLGAEVAVTASAAKLELCRKLGADIVIDYRAEEFEQVLKNSCNVILDIMGAKYLDRNISALASDGHMVIIGMQGGVKAELNIGKLLMKRGTVSATALRSRPLADKAEICRTTVQRVWPLLAAGEIKPMVDKVVPLDQAAEAHRMLAAGEISGKVVLTVAE